jgi:hypothetical protein
VFSVGTWPLGAIKTTQQVERASGAWLKLEFGQLLWGQMVRIPVHSIIKSGLTRSERSDEIF